MASPHTQGILIGGILAALVFGIGGVFAKAGIQAGIGLGWYVTIMGLATTFAGLVLFLFDATITLNLRSGLLITAFGVASGIGTGLVGIAMQQYRVPLSVLSPLYNMNTLITVLLALWIFSEWKQVHIWELLPGVILIILGGILVARA